MKGRTARIQTKRVYDPPSPADGERFLVDRLWPRGLKKEDLRLTGWLKEAAPSNALRQWFHRVPGKWAEFQRRYFAELEQHPQTSQPLLDAARRGTITLLFSSKDLERNNAVVLKRFLERKVPKSAA